MPGFGFHRSGGNAWPFFTVVACAKPSRLRPPHRTNTAAVEKPPGEWNTYDIVVSGDTITLAVNGALMNCMTGVQPSGGMIAFENEGTPIDFRNIEVTPLSAAKELNAPMPK